MSTLSTATEFPIIADLPPCPRCHSHPRRYFAPYTGRTEWVWLGCPCHQTEPMPPRKATDACWRSWVDTHTPPLPLEAVEVERDSDGL